MPGNYLLSATAQDGFTGVEVNTTLGYGITGIPLTAVTVQASLASPQPVGTPITLTAAATGGTDVQYQFWVYNPAAVPAWSQLQAYSRQAACSWTPAAPGNYLFAITAQDGVIGTEASTTLWYYLTVIPLTSVQVQASPAPPQMIGTPIALTATAIGGSNVRFQFWLYNPTASPAWSELQAYSASATCCWTPTTAGWYLLSVTAHDSASGIEVNTTRWYQISTVPPLSRVSVTTTPASPLPANTPITLTATATGGTSVQYQFWVYDPATPSAWSQLQAYSSQNSCSWTPTAAGSYLFSVTAKDEQTGIEVNTVLWYTVD